MTKEELERIKQAYYSGLKVQIWFDGHWEIFDARDYSMYSDPFSENRLYRIVGSAYADIAEKRIAELEKENNKLESRNDKLVKMYNEVVERQNSFQQSLYKDLAELKNEISVLLSCKNCPENKGGYICQKEYENKCLAQKIQYIKELQEENAELEKENAELKEKLNFSTQYYQGEKAKEQLSEAKKIIENIIRVTWGEGWNYSLDWKVKAEQFLNSEVKK